MNILNKCKGSSLVWVMIVFIFLITISAALLTATYSSFNSANQQQISQQAYFTARSAVNATIDYIQINSNDINAMNNLATNVGTGTVVSMGTYNVTVKYVDANNNVVTGPTNKMKIVATASYNGQTNNVAAYLTKPATIAANPTDKLFYITGPTSSGIGQCSITGDLYFSGDFSLSSGSSVSGSIVCSGNASITGAGATTNGLISFGNVTIGNSGKVTGDVKAKGTLTLSGSGIITGNAFCDGSLAMISGSGKINGDATIGQNASFGGSTHVYSDLITGGVYTPSNVSSYVTGTATKNAAVPPLDLSSYTTSTLPTISVPTVAQNAQLYTPVTLTNNTINNSGRLANNGTLYLNTNSLSYGTIVTIDASSKDISLLISNTDYNVNNGVDFKVNGSHNVTIYMTGNSSFDLAANSFVGMDSGSETPTIFVIGDNTQAVTLTSNSELDAYVYIPNGSFSASGSPITIYKFQGVMVVKTVTVSSGVKLFYVKPLNLASSPLSALASNGSGGSWNIESWSNT